MHGKTILGNILRFYKIHVHVVYDEIHALSDLFYATGFCKFCISKFLKPKAKSDKTHAPPDLSFIHSGFAVFSVLQNSMLCVI